MWRANKNTLLKWIEGNYEGVLLLYVFACYIVGLQRGGATVSKKGTLPKGGTHKTYIYMVNLHAHR